MTTEYTLSHITHNLLSLTDVFEDIVAVVFTATGAYYVKPDKLTDINVPKNFLEPQTCRTYTMRAIFTPDKVRNAIGKIEL